MHECLFDGNNEKELGNLAIHRQPALQRAVTDNLPFAAYPKGIAVSWNDKKQSDLGMGEQVLERIRSVVTRSVRDRERLFAQDGHEARGIALGREV
jgi:hypothetical protein